MALPVVTTTNQPIHEPVADAGDPKTRRKLLFFDRGKILVCVAVFFFFTVVKRHADIPILSWSDVINEQLRAKRWLLYLCLGEILRQTHYLACEHFGGYNQFWVQKVWGGWDRFWTNRNPWFRFRMGRMAKTATVVGIVIVFLSWMWSISILDAFSEAPARIWNVAFSPAQGLPFIIQIMFYIFMAIIQFVAIFWFMSRGGVDTLAPDEVKERFRDVYGQDKVVQQVKENILFLAKPQEIEKHGGYVPGGLLLWGPPGTGKTLIAKAVAGETGRPFVFVEPGAFKAMFFGVGILKVKSLYKKVRKLALRHGGVIVFFDEADVLGNRGGAIASRKPASPHAIDLLTRCNGLHYMHPTMAHVAATDILTRHAEVEPAPSGIKAIIAGLGGGGSFDGSLQAILTEMSGLEKPRGIITRRLRKVLCMPAKRPPKYRIMHMMATNAPDALDPALLRPGRIDRIYKVDYPNLDGRIVTFNGYLNKIKHSITDDQVERMALMSPRASGAVVKDIVNESIIVALRGGREVVEWQDFLYAKQLKTHGMSEDAHPMSLERHAVAIHEAGHAVGFVRLMRRLLIDVATIERRGNVGGFVAAVPSEEPGFPWKGQQEHDVIVSLASLAAERHFFGGDNSVGVGGDLAASTAVVASMLNRSAMGDALASAAGFDGGDRSRGQFSDKIEVKLQELYARAQRLIEENEWFVLAISHALEQHWTISGEDVEAIQTGEKGPLVDGRWYHTQDFLDRYRAYHDEAVAAHREQRQLIVELPLPSAVLVGAGAPLPPAGAPMAAVAAPAVAAVLTPVRPELLPTPAQTQAGSNGGDSATTSNGHGGVSEPVNGNGAAEPESVPAPTGTAPEAPSADLADVVSDPASTNGGSAPQNESGLPAL